jgi:hypothetical protein
MPVQSRAVSVRVAGKLHPAEQEAYYRDTNPVTVRDARRTIAELLADDG